jgi:predicted membrane-bound spermidine synthase
MLACYGVCYPVVADSSAALLGLRFVLLFALFLPPTFLMGGTLPLLLDGLVAEDRRIASRTGFLYACNIVGAVVGVLLTCYVAIPRIGMNGASLAGGVGNALLGLVALWYFRARAPIHTEASAGRVEPRLLVVAFLTGFVAIGLQIVWARYFSILEVTTIYTTAMLLPDDEVVTRTWI